MPHTPPSNSSLQAVLNPDTIVVPKQTSSGAYLRGGLQMRRDAVMDDLGSSVPEVSVEFFFKSAAPQVQAIDTAALKAKLVHSGHIANNRWDVFKKDPTDANVHEDMAFNPFGKVIEQIVEYSGLYPSDKQLDFVQNPHQAPHSERSNSTRPDSFLVRRLRNSQTPRRSGSEEQDISPNILWDDIAVSGEYKKKAGDKELDDVGFAIRLIWVIQAYFPDKGRTQSGVEHASRVAQRSSS
jgi:hypothetical protein